MKLSDIPFQAIDWSAVAPTEHADHWCERGHVVYVLEGELVNELRDGRSNVLTAGQGYVVADGDGAHRSRGADFLIRGLPAPGQKLTTAVSRLTRRHGDRKITACGARHARCSALHSP